MPVADQQVVFLGTPHAAAIVLQSLIGASIPVVHVITRPDAKRGRGGKTSPSPVKEVALQHGINVSHDLAWLHENSDHNVLGVVVAYGRIIPESVLLKTPMINVHFSLLPRWRGAAPVERAILAGDSETGVCIMQVEPTLDTGAVYASTRVPITDQMTTEELTEVLSHEGGRLLVATLLHGLKNPVAQIGEVTYAEKISSSEGRINWNRSSEFISRQVRALRAFTECEGARLRIVEVTTGDGELAAGEVGANGLVGTGDGCLALVRVQPEGKPVMDAHAWLRGRPRLPRFS